MVILSALSIEYGYDNWYIENVDWIKLLIRRNQYEKDISKHY